MVEASLPSNTLCEIGTSAGEEEHKCRTLHKEKMRGCDVVVHVWTRVRIGEVRIMIGARIKTIGDGKCEALVMRAQLKAGYPAG